MAQLGGRSRGPVQQFASDDDAAADTRPQRQQHHGVGLGPGPRPVFAEGSCVGIVLDDGGKPQALGHAGP